MSNEGYDGHGSELSMAVRVVEGLSESERTQKRIGLWQTPLAPNGGRVNPKDMSTTGKLANGKKRQVGLEHQVRMVEAGLWPTPKASPSGPDYARTKRPGSGGDDLATAVARTIPTPSSSDYRQSSAPGQRRRQLNDPAMGIIPSGGQLNPTWVEWLMGFPLGWTDCDVSATPSSRRSPSGSPDD